MEQNITNNISRRDFIKQSGAALAGATIASSLTAAANINTVPKKIRIGVVGGGFGCGFQWHEHPDCIVEAVSDLIEGRRKNMMKVYNCTKSYNSLEELVKDKNIDAVAVFTGAPDHVKHCVEVLKHGKHVICAVPACYTLDEAHKLFDTVKKTGLTYMMAETSYYQQFTISARKFQQDKLFGEIFYCESEYQHPGLEALFFNADGSITWRHGFPPMNYPTHCTAHLVSVTGERLTEVACHGWGNNDPIVKKNVYNNPFWNESAMFKTSKNHAFRVNVWWKGAFKNIEGARWIGDKMSFYSRSANGQGPLIIRAEGATKGKDSAGFPIDLPAFEEYKQPQWYMTDMLPEPLRHESGHEDSHTFLTHEFIDALVHNRKPTVNIYEALAYTVPGIIAHESALKDGELMKIPQFDEKKA